MGEKTRGVDTLRPANTSGYPWSDVGTAFDFRAGLAFTAPDLRHARRGANSLLDLVDAVHNRTTANRLEGELDTFFAELEHTCVTSGLPHGQPGEVDERRLAQAAFTVALLEVAFRAGADPRSPLVTGAATLDAERLGQLATDVVVDDLVALAGTVDQVLRPALVGREPVHVGPVFADSVAVGGADADLVAGGVLLEFKATVKTAMRREWYYQLIGYALLDVDDAFTLGDVGFFLPRQRQVITWPIDELIAQMSSGKYTDVATLRDELHQLLAA